MLIMWDHGEIFINNSCNILWSPTLSKDLTGFKKLSGPGGSESELAELENLQNGVGVHSVNSKILPILIRTVENTTNQVGLSVHCFLPGEPIKPWHNFKSRD